MKAIVARSFRDKYTKDRYIKGQIYESDDRWRIEALQKAGFLKGAPLFTVEIAKVNDEQQFQSVTDSNDYQLMTKKELEELLVQRSINFHKKQKKAELVELLMGGDG